LKKLFGWRKRGFSQSEKRNKKKLKAIKISKHKQGSTIMAIKLCSKAATEREKEEKKSS
jgi:hypothetical protein